MKKYRMNAIQYKFWMDHLLKYPSNDYNDPNYTFVVSGNLSIPHLKETYLKLMEEYPLLCSHVREENGVPYFCCDEASIEVPFYFQNLPSAEVAVAEKTIDDLVACPFDLSREYPCRFYALYDGHQYYLLHMFHHTVMDGGSFPLAFRRLSAIYNSLLEGSYQLESQLEGITSYHAALEQACHRHLEEDLEYWNNYMEGVPLQLAVPHVADTASTDEAFDFSLGNGMYRDVQALCKAEHTSPFRIYAAAWALTLARVSRVDELLMDHTLNLRPQGNDKLLGVFVNNLPLRFNFAAEHQSFREILLKISEDRKEERQHQYAFYHDILLRQNPSEGQHGTVNVSVNYPAELKKMTLDLSGCTCVPFKHVNVDLSFDLCLMIEDDWCLSCTIRHQSHFSAAFVRSLSIVFGEILRQVVGNLDIRIADLQLLPDQMQQSVTAKETLRVAQAVAPQTFFPRFRQVVEQYGSCPAVTYQSAGLTYQELDRLSDRVAAFLVQQGWRQRAIALSTPKNLMMLAGMLGIMKSGNIYLPVDYELPAERIRFMMDDCQVAAVLTTQDTPVDFESMPVFLVEEITDLTKGGEEQHAPEVQLQPTEVAYIIYTSGTTGKPKAIPIQHGMLYQTIINITDALKVSATDKMVQFANICFDASLYEIFPILNVGGELVLPQLEERKDPQLYLDFLNTSKSTVACIPPAFMALLPEADVPHLSTIMVGGDLLPHSAMQRWLGDRRMVNAYGPTENTVDVTYSVLCPDSVPNDIGEAVAGVSCYVVDAFGHLVPDGILGELYVGGVKLTSGYINRPELNREKFISNPYVSEEDKRLGRNLYLYKTGDLVVRREDGHLLFMGRSDFQVKLNGYRIEQGDIESKISEYGHGVRNVLVTLYEENQRKQLVAYVLADTPETFDKVALKCYLQEQLPAYMVPAAFVVLGEFPYNASGKVVRKLLPAPSLSASEQRESVSPVTATEKQLATLWQRFLVGEEPGRDDDFMSMGGDSLAVIQLAFAVEETFGTVVHASDLYRHTSLSAMAGFIDSQLQQVTKEEDVVVPEVDAVLPLSPTQKSLWLQCKQSEEMSGFYNVPCFFPCPENTEPEQLETVLNQLVEHQDSFRMSFPLDEEQKPYVEVADHVPFRLKPEQIAPDELGGCFKKDQDIRFDLENGPLYCIHIYQVAHGRLYCSLTMHHLISDGWSAELIQLWVTQTLSGEDDGQIQWNGSYAAYIRSCQQSLQSEHHQQCLSYWEQQLTDMNDLLLFDQRKGSEKGIRGGMCNFTFPETCVQKAKAFCAQQALTPFEVYCGVYLLFLARWSGQTDFAIGFPYLGREEGRFRQVVGFFVETLPLCYKKDYNELTFAAYMKAIHQQIVDAERHALSFDQLVGIARAQAGLPQLQLIQTFFTLGKDEVFYQYLQKENVPFGAVMSILMGEEQVTCRMEYQYACLSEREVAGAFEDYVTLLSEVVSDASLPVTSYGMAPETYRQSVIAANACMGLASAETPVFMERFSAAVRTQPDKVALMEGENTVTYRELDHRSEQLAAYIQHSGIPVPSPIAVHRVSSIDTLTIILGVLKAGCCYVPVDVELPEARKEFILKDAGCTMIFDEEHPTQGKVLSVDRCPAQWEGIAYVIYTSGTTGRPKGVPVRHAALAHLLDVLPEVSRMTSDSRVLLFASISFDASVTQLFTSLSLGATLVIARPQERKDPSLLADLLVRQSISYLEMPAAILPLLPQREYPSLETVIVGGESSSSAVLRSWAKKYRVINAYGPTENTVDTSLCVVDEHFESNDIGFPLPGVSCYVLDQHRHIVPPNGVGELYIGGMQLTQGYLGRPELNREKFIENPYATAEEKAAGVNAVLYRSGDLVKRRRDGHLIFMGRKDFQVKWHGYRIELGEIESQIRKYDVAVKGTGVLLEQVGERMQLVAYVQVDDPQSFSEKALRNYLKSQLPVYMVPSAVVLMEQLPMTANGKLDRRRLPRPDTVAPSVDLMEACVTETEKELAAIWTKLLPGQQLGRHDDFLSLGGDSLAVIQMSFAIEERWAIRISAADIYRHLALSDLAAWIEQQQQAHQTAVGDADSEWQPEDPHCPLAPSQQSLWLKCVQSDEIRDSYNLPCFFECPQGTTAERFETFFNGLLEGQESFRLSFPTSDSGQPYLRLSPYCWTAVEVVEISADQLNRSLEADLKVSFSLSEGPLYRVRLYHVDGQRYNCSLVMHHLISDGWSAQWIMAAARRYLNGEEAEGARYPGKYLEYAREAAALKGATEYQERLDYWKDTLTGVSDLALLQPKKGHVESLGGEAYICAFPQGLADEVSAFCKENSCTRFDCYCFVYLLLLARLSGRADFAIGVPYLGRERGKYQSVVGYFVNLLPLCYHRSYSTLTFRQLVQTLHNDLVEAENHSAALDDIVQAQQETGGASNLQLVQTLFTYEERTLLHDALQQYGHADFGVILSVVYSEEGSECHFLYQRDCMDEREVKGWAEAYFALLQSVVRQPDYTLGSYPLVSEQHREQMLRDNICYPTADQAPLPFLQRFAATVQRYPDKTAAVFRGDSISYAELDSMSDEVRNRILSAGIIAPASIAVNMVASLHSMAVIIGILKAGCTYVPVDVNWPAERRDFILKDAACVMSFSEDNYPQGVLLDTGVFPKAEYQDKAYVIYTSGTTGVPKGVPISRSAMAFLAEEVRKDYEVEPESRVLLFASIGFDVSVADIFSSFAVGATLVIAAPEERKDPNLLFDLLKDQQVTCASIPPAMLLVLPRKELPQLSVMVVAGESPVYSALMYWAKGRKMINAYGPTESTVYTTLCVVEEDYEADDIGRPLPGVTCYVLDKQMQLVPDGIKGELYIGGVQLTSGYLHRPELNEEKFIPNPFVTGEDRKRGLNTVLYKCGDVVVRRPNGHLVFVGRTDRQVKLRGFRIELSEIENRLMQCPGVQRAVVQVHKQEEQEELVAYVQSDQLVAPKELQQILRTQMPIYMVPGKWAVLQKFPLTVNGKTDWRRMPEPEVVMGEEQVMPATADERWLWKTACEILGTAAIGVETDLLDAGMTSIQVMELVMRACEADSHFCFNISSVYRYRTLRKLLQHQGSKLYFWINTYSPEKPTMVLVCGFPNLKPFYDQFIEFFRDKFNIFVFESYIEYFKNKTEISVSTLLEDYDQQLQVALGGMKIDLVTGYCMGSEVALRLAKNLQQEGWGTPKVLLMEAFWERAKGVKVPHISDNIWVQRNYEMTQDLFNTYEPVDYDGEMLITFAAHASRRMYLDQEEDADENIVEEAQKVVLNNKAKWRKEYPQMPYLEVDATHWTYFEPKPLRQLWEAMLKYWY